MSTAVPLITRFVDYVKALPDSRPVDITYHYCSSADARDETESDTVLTIMSPDMSISVGSTLMFIEQGVAVYFSDNRYRRASIVSIEPMDKFGARLAERARGQAPRIILVGKYEKCNENDLKGYIRKSSAASFLYRLKVSPPLSGPSATVTFYDETMSYSTPVPPALVQGYRVVSAKYYRSDWTRRKINLLKWILETLGAGRELGTPPVEYTADEYQCASEVLTEMGIPATFSH